MEAALISVPLDSLTALVDAGGRPHLSSRLLPFTFVIHYNVDYSLSDPGGMEGWVGHVGWPIADGVTTKWSPVPLAVWRRVGKVRRPRPAFYPLCYVAWLMKSKRSDV